MFIPRRNSSFRLAAAPLVALCAAACASPMQMAADFAASPLVSLAAGAAGVRAQDARMPYKSQVPAGAPAAIDGVWLIQSVNARVRIEGGRAIAVDPNTYAVVMNVKPDQVPLRDIRPQGGGKFAGIDLSVGNAPITFTIQPDGSLRVEVLGIQDTYVPIGIDNPPAFAAEMQQAGLTPISLPGPMPAASTPGYPAPAAQPYPAQPYPPAGYAAPPYTQPQPVYPPAPSAQQQPPPAAPPPRPGLTPIE